MADNKTEGLEKLVRQMVEDDESGERLVDTWNDLALGHDTLLHFRYENPQLKDLDGRSILFAAIALQKYKVAKEIVKVCPELIKECPQSEMKVATGLNILKRWWTGETVTEYPSHMTDGLTPFHLLVAFGSTQLVKEVLDLIEDNTVMTCEARGLQLEGTHFMSKLPLNIAACRNSPDLVQLLLDKGADVGKTNMHGDTLLHSLVKYANCFPSTENGARGMLKILVMLCRDDSEKIVLPKNGKNGQEVTITSENISPEVMEVLRKRNHENKTALQLANEYSLISISKLLLDVNMRVTRYDLAYEIRRYDITEIDKEAMVKQRLFTSDVDTESDKFSMYEQSVTELICSRSVNVAIQMVEHECIEELICRKWGRYRWVAAGFGVFHLSFLCLLCVYAAAKSAAIQNKNWTSNWFLLCTAMVSLIVAVLHLIMELVLRTFLSRQPLYFSSIHQNSVYRMSLLLFSGCVLTDSIIYLVQGPSSNSFLVFSLLPGSWYQLCFLRGVPFLSTHILLINQALVNTLLPMAILIMLMLGVFSAMLFSLFQLQEGVLDTNEEFNTFGSSLLRLGKILVGLADIENMSLRLEDTLVVVLYFLFVILVSFLMLNALISIMTNDFEPTYNNRIQIDYLQKLSLSIYLEGIMLPLAIFCTSKLLTSSEELGRQTMTTWGLGRCILSFRKVRCDQHTSPPSLLHQKKFADKNVKQQNEDVTKLTKTVEQVQEDFTKSTKTLEQVQEDVTKLTKTLEQVLHAKLNVQGDSLDMVSQTGRPNTTQYSALVTQQLPPPQASPLTRSSPSPNKSPLSTSAPSPPPPSPPPQAISPQSAYPPSSSSSRLSPPPRPSCPTPDKAGRIKRARELSLESSKKKWFDHIDPALPALTPVAVTEGGDSIGSSMLDSGASRSTLDNANTYH